MDAMLTNLHWIPIPKELIGGMCGFLVATLLSRDPAKPYLYQSKTGKKVPRWMWIGFGVTIGTLIGTQC